MIKFEIRSVFNFENFLFCKVFCFDFENIDSVSICILVIQIEIYGFFVFSLLVFTDSKVFYAYFRTVQVFLILRVIQSFHFY